MTKKNEQKVLDRINELKSLYGLSESEMILTNQMLKVIVVTMPSLSPELMLKCMKAMTAMVEATFDEVDNA